ncbi:SU10 major capsid protein [Buttiauxella sp.]|uniref:SU10 major capsid protein n=1 Tax=Buttiauxella sp. TaxID=1972222 RepID=UPI003C78F587
MPALNSYELNGVKDSFAEWISNISPQDFPFQAMIGKTTATQSKFEWQCDSDSPVDPNNALMESFEFADLDDTFAATIPMTGYTQKMGKAVKVTGDADAQAAWGRGTESDHQSHKKASELKRDIENAFLSTTKTQAEVKPTTPRRLGGFDSQVSTIDGGTTRIGDPLTGTATYITAAAAGKPQMTDIFAGMAALWTTGGKPEVLMCSETMKDVISDAQEAGGARVRIFENTAELSVEVNTITDALGQTVRVVYNRHMPADTVYLFNSKDWEAVMFRAPETVPVAKTGDYKKVVFMVDIGLRHRNPWASAVIAPFAAA